MRSSTSISAILCRPFCARCAWTLSPLAVLRTFLNAVCSVATCEDVSLFASCSSSSDLSSDAARAIIASSSFVAFLASSAARSLWLCRRWTSRSICVPCKAAEERFCRSFSSSSLASSAARARRCIVLKTALKRSTVLLRATYCAVRILRSALSFWICCTACRCFSSSLSTRRSASVLGHSPMSWRPFAIPMVCSAFSEASASC
mmetsp:Transcript_12249/g.45403  ORF Transcript_12249/g.45403 Transcript_12249/m.45403 type:complete len:204 (+) Transcript_12249:309-920(+)